VQRFFDPLANLCLLGLSEGGTDSIVIEGVWSSGKPYLVGIYIGCIKRLHISEIMPLLAMQIIEFPKARREKKDELPN